MFKDKYRETFSDIKADNKLKEKTKRICKNGGVTDMRKRINKAAVAVAACAAIFVSGVNISPTLAAGMENIPILGVVSKVVSLRTYTEKNDDNTVKVNQPEVKGAVHINKEIENAIAQYKEEAQKSIDEYKEAFIATGGTEEEFEAKNIEVVVDYEVKADNEKYISFVISMYENWLSSSARYIYYNLDAHTGETITLKDLLGEDYINIANKAISAEIPERVESEGYFTGEMGFTTITDDTDFYINADGNPVIVFDKYEIAPGSAGRPEFVISTGAEKAALSEIKADYTVTKKYADTDKNIAYPEISGYKGELLADYMNQSLYSIVEKFSNEGYSNLKLDYEITRMDNDILSVLYKGTVDMEGIGNIKIVDSINLDTAKTGQQITVDNYIKQDEKSKFESVLESSAKAAGIDKIEAEGMKMYFKDDEVIFYYTPLDDSAEYKAYIPVKESDLKGIAVEEFEQVYFS